MFKKVSRAFRASAVLVSTLLLMILAEPSVSSGTPAGILLYHRDGGNVFLLLANDSKRERGWSGFGGAAEPGESLRATAARETEEETRGYFPRAWLEEQIAEQNPLLTGGFGLYFVEVAFVPAQRVMNNPIPGQHAAMQEFQCYAWIPFSELEPAFSQERPSKADLKVSPLYVPKGCESQSFWPVWIGSMRDAHKQAAFPWYRGDENEPGNSQDAGGSS